jgi:hypothetical protein
MIICGIQQNHTAHKFDPKLHPASMTKKLFPWVLQMWALCVFAILLSWKVTYPKTTAAEGP